MRISVVISSHNQAVDLAATLESVCAQDHPDIEVLVFDGGSTDGSVEILRQWTSTAGGLPIRWVSQPDRGQADATNQGLRASTGEVLASLQAGDVYRAGAFSAVAAHFRARADCLALYGRAYQLHPDGSVLDKYPTEPWDYDRLLEACFLCRPAVFWRRGIIERFGVFDDTLLQAWDYEYWLRVGRQQPFEYLDEVYLGATRLSEEDNASGRWALAPLEFAQTVKKYSPHPEPVLHWIKCLARRQGDEPGPAAPAGRQRTAAALVARCLLYANELEVPLTEAFLEGLENDLSGVDL